MPDEVVVVIGVGGMGRVIARRQGIGKALLLADHNEQALQAVVDELKADGHNVIGQRVDVSSRASVSGLAQAAAGLGRVAQVAHTAGLSPAQSPTAAILAVDLVGGGGIWQDRRLRWRRCGDCQHGRTHAVRAHRRASGGGNFASSMTNINAFYPQRFKGWALGLNAGGGNIGVPVIQVIGLLVIATVGNRSPHWVAAIYLVLIAFAAVGAALFMDNLADQKTDGRSLIDVMKYRDSWIIAFLYIGTFGSFIGFSFAFGQVLQLNFLAGLAHSGVTPAQAAAQASLHAAQIAFIGPLLGSLARPFGGWLSDRTGGGKISLYAFIAMIFGAGILVAAGTISDRGAGAPSGSIMTAYVIGFIILFVVSGIGNGSVYKMIPSVFAAKARSAGLDETWSRTMSGALIGVAGAIGALGGVAINLVLRASYLSAAKSATMAFWVFLVFYVICAAVTWYAYVRRPMTVSVPAISSSKNEVAV